jgi:regulator of protease activity HflC (stomatin/prohibitin superfamily)
MMVELTKKNLALRKLRSLLTRSVVMVVLALIVVTIAYNSCTYRVMPNEFAVEQVRFGSKTGVGDRAYTAGLYFVGVGTTMHPFPREVHILEASNERAESRSKAASADVGRRVDEYFEVRDRVLGKSTHRRIDALNVQTSDGYAVSADVTLLYAIDDPVKIAKEFGWGSAYVDSFVINTFRNGALATLGKMSAEMFYGEKERVAAVKEAEEFLRERFKDRGFKVEGLLLSSYHYSETYEHSLREKKVAVQLTEKNRKESLVNEERAKLQQIESKGQAAITIAESEVNAQIAKIRAEASLYSAQVHAKADRELGLAEAEAKRLKSDALTQSGGRYVVALETARMFDNIEAAVMTPEQYVAFIRAAWALIGLSGAPPAIGAK